ncbi:MAG: hypothetical protein ACL93V_00515 [Candidatus Electrothrix sp. YB6]
MAKLSVSVSSRKRDLIEWDFTQLPCRKEDTPSKGGGIIMMAGSTFFIGMPTLAVIMSIRDGTFEPAMLMALILTVSGIGLFLFGLYLFSARTVTEFDGKTFRYRSKSLFGSKAWDEPLSKYEGVLARSKYHSGGRNSSSYTDYIVELIHPDEQRRITLWQSRNSSSGHRANWEKYCRQFGLPALKEDGEGYTRRAPDDLDKSVRELAAEGKLEIPFDPAAAVPEVLKLNIQGDQLEMVIGTPKTPLWKWLIGMVITFAIPALFIWIGGGHAVFGALFGVLMVGAFIWTLIATPLVRINRKGLHVLYRTPWGETRGKRISAEAIRNVRVGKARPRQSSPSVVVETAATNHAIGQGLEEDALEWLKNCILSKVADG